MERIRRGGLVVVAAVVLVAIVLGSSAVAAPERTVATDSDDTRRTLIGVQGGGERWHDYGRVRMVEGTEFTWTEDSADSYFDVTRRPDGTVLAGFMHSGYEAGCGPYDPPCTKTGFRIIDPDAEGGPTVVEEYSYPVATPSNSETHDVERLESGEYLLSGMEYERIFTVRDGQVTWQWNASSFYDAPEDTTDRDWLHINDVDAINGTHYLVSIRNANQLVVVERGTGVVEVVNEDTDDSNDDDCTDPEGPPTVQLVDEDGDGEVRCGDPTVIDHQHNPQWLGPGAILVADSENNRIVELHERDGSWEPVWSIDSPDGIELVFPRDADRLPNNNTLITDTINRRVVEIAPNGTVVWSVRIEHLPYEAERVPVGETVGGPRYTGNGTVERAPTEDEGVALLSPVTRLAHSLLPWLPFWVTEPQIAVILVGLLVGLVGAGDLLLGVYGKVLAEIGRRTPGTSGHERR